MGCRPDIRKTWPIGLDLGARSHLGALDCRVNYLIGRIPIQGLCGFTFSRTSFGMWALEILMEELLKPKTNLGFRALGLGFWVRDLGFRVFSLGCRTDKRLLQVLRRAA